MKKIMMLVLICGTVLSCRGQEKTEVSSDQKTKGDTAQNEVIKTDAEWRQILTPEQYEVLRNKGTERAHTGEYVNNFAAGTYVCAACGNVLFKSDAKFASDCGWPSFDKAVAGAVKYHDDSTFGMSRIEVTCAACGGHLGHVFDDGPEETTGKRYCTNSVSVKFIPANNN